MLLDRSKFVTLICNFLKMDRPIYLSRTQGEWDAIDAAIKKMGRKNLNKFIRSEVSKLGNAYVECPNCITKASGEKKEKRPKIPMESYERLEKIAERMDIHVSTVVDLFIISPLLKPDTSTQGATGNGS